MRSCPRVSFQTFSFKTKFIIRAIVSPLRSRWFDHRYWKLITAFR
jgi:hypothetical protein